MSCSHKAALVSNLEHYAIRQKAGWPLADPVSGTPLRFISMEHKMLRILGKQGVRYAGEWEREEFEWEREGGIPWMQLHRQK